MNKIGAIISFCTNDLRFLDKCLSAVVPFSQQIIIPVCDHLYNGKREDPEVLNRIYQKYPHVDFIEFAYSASEVYGTYAPLIEGSPGWSQHWHNTARLIGYYFLKTEIDTVLFCDVDEIFSEDLNDFDLSSYEAVRFGTYWYFKEASRCATVTPDGPLLVKREKLTRELLLDEDERMGLFFKIEGKKVREFCPNGKPIVHHYSWVRSEKEMEQKVKCWGHHWERDWATLMKQEGDFVRHYSYEEVKPFWDPLAEEVILPDGVEEVKNVIRVTPKDIFRRELLEMIKE